MLSTKKSANTKPNSLQQQVRLLLNRSNLHHEGQLKDRIIWIHLKAIMLSLYGEGADVKKQLNEFDQQWKLLEKSETYRLSVWEKGDPRLK